MPEPMASETADARVTRLIRVGHPSARAEVLARHQDAALGQAGLYCPDDQDAHRLAEEAFALTLQAVREGGGPSAAWRPYLASAVRLTAARWAGDGLDARLSAGFTAWLAALPGSEDPASAAVSAEEDSVMLRALRALPEHWQAALWRAFADEHGNPGNPPPSAATRDGLWEAYLQAFAQTSDRACRHLAAAMGDSVRHRTAHPNLDRHTAACDRCRRARTELSAIHTWNPDRLYGALMLWTARRPAGPPAAAPPGLGQTSLPLAAAPTAARHAAAPTTDDRHRDHRRSLVLCAGAAVTTVVVIVAVTAAIPEPDGHPRSSAPVVTVPVTTSPVVSGAVSASPVPSAAPTTAGPTAPVAAPPASSAAPSPTAPSSSAPSPTGRPAGFRLLNTTSGLCVGPEDPAGPSIELQSCSQDASQRWERIAAGNNTYQLRNTGTGRCLDGTTGGGNTVKVVQAECLPASDREVQLWKFSPEPDGTAFRLFFVPPVPSSDYATHLLGPVEWTKVRPPSEGTYIAQLPDYYHSASFAFTADQGP
ncbi:RICIN domain-containing protein [Kitasatospora sp. NBC_00374]|uniref:RICIN domain-containing protein n=1 Tax=Kitasatospora sp. NBC_00374 TaxID=2975964 RepID=UPI0030DE5705